MCVEAKKKGLSILHPSNPSSTCRKIVRDSDFHSPSFSLEIDFEEGELESNLSQDGKCVLAN